jgi:hypothetical protein
MNTARVTTVSAIKERVVQFVSSNIKDSDCVALALAANFPRDRDEVFGMLLSNSVCKKALKHADELAITHAEWNVLFGKEGSFASEVSARSIASDKDFEPYVESIAGALRCSLTEVASKEQWKRATSKLSCYTALHTDHAEDWVSSVLGGIVKADTRRLDDVRSCIEDDDTDCMLLSKTVLALAQCVT